MQRKLLFVTLLIIALCYACKKNNPAQPVTGGACENLTVTGSDSAISLVTRVTTSATEIIKITGSTRTVVASAAGYEFWGATLSPDKSKFACFRSVTTNSVNVNDYTTAELWVFNIDGSNGHSITTLSATGWNAMGMADWSPDGLHLALAAEKNETDGNLHWDIFITDTLGSSPVRMNTRLGYFTHPRFANGDPNLITYTAWPTGITTGSTSLCEIFYAGINPSFQFTSETRVTSDVKYDYSPGFSPDNSLIYYCKATSSASNAPVELYTYTISAASNNLLLSNHLVNENPCWCAYNNRIYYINKMTPNCIRNVSVTDASLLSNIRFYSEMNTHYYHIYTR